MKTSAQRIPGDVFDIPLITAALLPSAGFSCNTFFQVNLKKLLLFYFFIYWQIKFQNRVDEKSIYLL